MELRDYVRVLRKSWTLILALTVVGVALGVGLTLATTKVYQATAQIYVSSNSQSNNTNSNSNFLLSRVQTYSSVATSPFVLTKVLQDPAVIAAYSATPASGPKSRASASRTPAGSASASTSATPSGSGSASGSSSASTSASSSASASTSTSGSTSPATSASSSPSPGASTSGSSGAAASTSRSASTSPSAGATTSPAGAFTPPPGLPTVQQLKSQITSDVPKGQALINLHVTDTDPVRATVLANALAKEFDAYIPSTEQKIPVVNTVTGNTSQQPAVKLTTIQPATVPGKPIKPNKTLNIGLGIVLGLIIGVGVAVVREVLDNTVKGAEDFESLGIPLLAQIGYDKRTSRSVIAFRADAHSARSESYRQLRTNLQFVDVDKPPKIIAVTSAVPGEGKTTTAINLAAALAEAGSRVCLVEADLRRPSIARALGLVTDVGFTTVVIGKAPIETVLQNAGRNLAVLTSGPIPPNPSELLVSQHARQVIYNIAEKVDFVVVDTPPLLPVTDGAEIATIADATLLVHRAAKTTKDQATRSLQALAKVGRRPVGVVLNMVSRARGGEYTYEYGYYYAAYRPNKNGKNSGKSNPGVMPAVHPDDAPASSDEPVVVAGTPATASAGQTQPARSTTATLVEPAPAAQSTDAPAPAADTADTEAAARRARHQRDDDAAPASKRGLFGRGRRDKRPTQDAPVSAATAGSPAAGPDPDTTRTVTLPAITVNGRDRAGDVAESAADEPTDEPTDELAAVRPDVASPVVDAPPTVVNDGESATGSDEFADDYPPFSAAEDDADEFTPVPPGNLDDVTIHLEGQDELPLEERQPLVEFDEDALDEALGVKSPDERP